MLLTVFCQQREILFGGTRRQASDEDKPLSFGKRHCKLLKLNEVYLTIIPLTQIRYKMIDSQRGAWCRVGNNHLISNKREWNNCFIKNNQEILQDLADFALQEQPEDNLVVDISWAWYNGSYTMAAKPIKSLELHCTMIQFF